MRKKNKDHILDGLYLSNLVFEFYLFCILLPFLSKNFLSVLRLSFLGFLSLLSERLLLLFDLEEPLPFSCFLGSGFSNESSTSTSFLSLISLFNSTVIIFSALDSANNLLAKLFNSTWLSESSDTTSSNNLLWRAFLT